MDTITGALQSKDGQHIFHPETQIKKVVGLEAQLAKAITNLTSNGGTITITKADGSTSTITIATSTSAGSTGGVTGVKGNAENTYRTGNVNLTPANIGAASTDIATATKAGLMSADMFSKLSGIESGAQKNSTALATTTMNGLMSKEDKSVLNTLSASSVTGVKGSAESSYRTGNVNLTAANVGAAASSHSHSATDITSGTLPITRGGTGRTSAPSMLINLASTAAAEIFSASPRPGVSGILPTANGGTGNSKGIAALGATYLTDVNLDELFSPGFYVLGSSTNGPLNDSRGYLIVFSGQPKWGLNINNQMLYQSVQLYLFTSFHFRWHDIYGNWYPWNRINLT